MKTDARDYRSISKLAQCLIELSPEQKQRMTFFLLNKGLMRPSWWIRLPLKFIRWRHGSFGVYAFVTKAGQSFSDTMIDQTFWWMLDGHDAEERTSIGGFSQREIDLIVDAYEKIITK